MKKGLGALEQGELAKCLGLKLEQGELIRGWEHGLHLKTLFSPKLARGKEKKVKTKS